MVLQVADLRKRPTRQEGSTSHPVLVRRSHVQTPPESLCEGLRSGPEVFAGVQGNDLVVGAVVSVDSTEPNAFTDVIDALSSVS